MDRAFDFLHANERESKPRGKGITGIRGPYYDPTEPRELRDVLDTARAYADAFEASRAAVGDFSGEKRRTITRSRTAE